MATNKTKTTKIAWTIMSASHISQALEKFIKLKMRKIAFAMTGLSVPLDGPSGCSNANETGSTEWRGFETLERCSAGICSTHEINLSRSTTVALLRA